MRNRDDRPWREHHLHVPREFDQGGRRAQYRWRGAHENDEAHSGRGPRGPGPDDAAASGPHPPQRVRGQRAPVGRQGYARGTDSDEAPGSAPRGPAAAQQRPGFNDGRFDGTDAYAATSGYDDYESEALYGSGFGEGDWSRTYRRGTHGLRARSTHRGATGEHRGHAPQDYRRSDQRLLEDVHERLTDDAYLDARAIRVAVEDGVVRLEGELAERWMKHHAEHVAARCFGVVDVDNRIRIGRRRD